MQSSVTLTERRQPAADLQARYAALNQQLFDGKLPTISIYWDALKSMGGKVEFRVRAQRDDWGRVHRTLTPDSVVMVMDNLYQRDGKSLDGLLVHEMIHVWFAAVEHDYVEQHGPKFMAKLRELQAKVDFTIPLKDTIAGLELAAHVADKPVYILWATSHNGTTPIFQFLPDKYGKDASLQRTVQLTVDDDIARGYIDPGAKILKMVSPAWTKLRLRTQIPRLYKARSYTQRHIMHERYPEAVAEAEAATPLWTSTQTAQETYWR